MARRSRAESDPVLGIVIAAAVAVFFVGYLVSAQLAIALGIRVRDAGSLLLLGAVSVSAAVWWWRRKRRRSRIARPAPGAPTREPIPAGLRFAVLRRDGFRCVYCGRGEPEGQRLHIDHLVPVARGGPTTMDNLVVACQDCNLGKSSQDLIGR